MRSALGESRAELSIWRKLTDLNWGLILLITLVASVGFATLYSAAGGRWDPWAARQILRFGMGLVIMVAVAVIDIRIWMRYAYLLYGLGIILLITVDLVGRIGMGAQRWLDFGFVQVQPSEIMKLALVLTLARYFHGISQEDVGRIRYLIVPMILVFLPAALVMKQPDLGTALMLVAVGGCLFFLAGVRLWKFGLAIALAAAATPIAWQLMHDYQRKRILIFLNPEQDPLGAGYHILQSKIALGSGGIFGKGYLEGTQSHLNFLPERHTDFIFTTLAEELGLVGGLSLVALYALLIAYAYAVGLRSRSHFGRLVGLGIASLLFIYVFVNIAMVTGLLPVVGLPLALVSYGGTAMLTVMTGFGLLMSVYLHRDIDIPRSAASAAL